MEGAVCRIDQGVKGPIAAVSNGHAHQLSIGEDTLSAVRDGIGSLVRAKVSFECLRCDYDFHVVCAGR
jgi:lipopolysaccharide biosynthesis regulator YciM